MYNTFHFLPFPCYFTSIFPWQFYFIYSILSIWNVFILSIRIQLLRYKSWKMFFLYTVLPSSRSNTINERTMAMTSNSITLRIRSFVCLFVLLFRWCVCVSGWRWHCSAHVQCYHQNTLVCHFKGVHIQWAHCQLLIGNEKKEWFIPIVADFLLIQNWDNEKHIKLKVFGC